MPDTLKYKIIKNLAQYTDYCDKHELLIIAEDDKHLDEIELLELLIEDYNQRITMGDNEILNPVELLKSLLRDSNMTQNELANSINVSRQLISDVLRYRRNISKEMTIKLSNFFSMSQEAFSRKYDLKENIQPKNEAITA